MIGWHDILDKRGLGGVQRLQAAWIYWLQRKREGWVVVVVGLIQGHTLHCFLFLSFLSYTLFLSKLLLNGIPWINSRQRFYAHTVPAHPMRDDRYSLQENWMLRNWQPLMTRTAPMLYHLCDPMNCVRWNVLLIRRGGRTWTLFQLAILTMKPC